MSPPMTMTAGLKKLTVPARTSPSDRPASRTMRIAVGSPARTRRDDVAAVGGVGAIRGQPLRERLTAGDGLQAADVPARHTTSSRR